MSTQSTRPENVVNGESTSPVSGRSSRSKKTSEGDAKKFCCIVCKNSHVPCDFATPCRRCAARGEPEKCIYQKPKKRGPKPLSAQISPDTMRRRAQNSSHLEEESSPQASVDEPLVSSLKNELEQLRLVTDEKRWQIERLNALVKALTNLSHGNTPQPRSPPALEPPRFSDHSCVIVNHRIVYTTNQLQSYFRYGSESMIGLSAFRFLHPRLFSKQSIEGAPPEVFLNSFTSKLCFIRKDLSCFLAHTSTHRYLGNVVVQSIHVDTAEEMDPVTEDLLSAIREKGSSANLLAVQANQGQKKVRLAETDTSSSISAEEPTVDFEDIFLSNPQLIDSIDTALQQLAPDAFAEFLSSFLEPDNAQRRTGVEADEDDVERELRILEELTSIQ